eukprot:scaffold258526_cov66-Cyclotella_meneghiniana.AAC.1
MQVEEGRKGPALCAPSLSKTSAYRTFSAYFLAGLRIASFHHVEIVKMENDYTSGAHFTIFT